jgi:glycosyltransferase involved in cell wall biosynthesis
VPDVVLPCLDEAAALPWVLSRMPAGYRPMVADNGSADGSADVARGGYGARVVDVPRQGFAADCHAGLLAATDDVVVCFLDADASLDPAAVPAVVPADLRTGRADVPRGQRPGYGDLPR